MSNLPPYPGGNNPYATNYNQPSGNNPYATNYNQPSTGGASNQYATNYSSTGGSNYNPGSSTPSNQYATNYTPSGGSNYNQSNYNPPAPSYGTPAQGSNYGTSQTASRFGAQAADTNAYAGSGGGFHSYSKEETRSFVNYINEWVQNDPDLRGILPINPDSEDVFRAIGSTCLLCKLVNAIKPNTVDERKIHKGSVSVFQQTENLTLAIQGCKDMGVVVSHIGPQDLLDAKPHMILGLVWQVVKIGLLGKLNFDQHPELVVMLSPTEDVSTFMRLAPEVNLLRWFNWHLNRSGYPKNVNNFSNDIKDAQPYLALLEQIAPHVVPKGVHQEPDARTRAQYVCDYAKQLGCGGFLAPEDILQGNDKLNMAFTAYLFNKYPGLEGLQDSMSHQKLQEVESALQQRYQEEDRLRAQRWDQEEADRRRAWEDQEMQRRRQLEAEEASRREQLAREEAEMRARLGAEAAAQEARMRQWQLQQQAEEQARKYEGERQAREFEEQRRRHEAEQERLRLEAAEKQRAWEAEQRLQQAKREEEERRRREEEQRRMAEEKRRQEEERRRAEEEEARRRQYEEQKRYEEEQRRKALAEEEARRKAWDEYYATQAANAAAQAAMEEEKRRRAAWDEYNKQQEAARQEAARQAAAEEARRQAAWAQYQQEQAAAAAAAQQQAMMTMQIQQQQAAAAQQAMMTMQAQQAAMMATRTVVVQPPPTVQKTTTVTKVVTTPAKPAKWPIPRLIVTVVRGNRLIKSDIFGKSDPYVKLVHNGNAQKTTWLKNTVDPVYNQDFEFRNVAQSDIILVQVWDHDTLGKDNFMGELKLTSGDFVDGDQSAFELRSRDFRADRVHGDLVLKFRLIYPK